MSVRDKKTRCTQWYTVKAYHRVHLDDVPFRNLVHTKVYYQVNIAYSRMNIHGNLLYTLNMHMVNDGRANHEDCST